MEQPELVICNNLRRIREERNLSYSQLADLTGVSKSMLRQIELGDSSPTINTLWKIANGLEIPFSTLLTPPSTPFLKMGFKENPPVLGTEGYRGYPLVTFDATRNFEVFYIEIDPGESLSADPHVGSVEEIMLVIQGTLEFRLHDEVILVQKDEMIRFNSNHPHYYHNPTDEMIRLFTIIYYRG